MAQFETENGFNGFMEPQGPVFVSFRWFCLDTPCSHSSWEYDGGFLSRWLLNSNIVQDEASPFWQFWHLFLGWVEVKNHQLDFFFPRMFIHGTGKKNPHLIQGFWFPRNRGTKTIGSIGAHQPARNAPPRGLAARLWLSCLCRNPRDEKSLAPRRWWITHPPGSVRFPDGSSKRLKPVN